eukprot:TRINITY_DN6282_c0_g2_i5.p1 TRINITY_DN6282_c0_g2~~TRINITY_DN6282_c0_g2_i5.p1  ORF type:complete len:329 (-),score=46.69 TRINITY_DN6282_c0_g2_i5:424-1410(-)
MHSLGCVGYISVDTMDAICEAIKTRKLLSSVEPSMQSIRGASHLFGGFGALKYRDDTIFDGLCKLLIRGIESNQCRSTDLVSVIHASGRLCYSNPKFLEAALSWLMGSESAWKQLDEKMLTGLMWSLTVFEVMTPQLFQQLALRLKDMMYESKKELEPPQLMQVYQAHFFLQSIYSENFFGDPDLNRLVRKARRVRRDEFTKKKQIISELHKEVLEAMEYIGVPHKREGLVQDNMFKVDVRIDNVPVVIEVDGKLHFCCNKPFRPLGHTVLRNRHLELLGWKVVTVPGFEWMELATVDEKKFYLIGKLKDVGVEIPSMPEDIFMVEGT